MFVSRFVFIGLLLQMVIFVPEVRSATREVALLSNIAPSTSDTFGFLGAPVLNNQGEVAFAAELNDDDFSGGIWSEGDGVESLRKVALIGDTAPGTAGATFSDVSPIPLLFNDIGDVAFRATLDDFVTPGLFADRDTTPLTKIALAGDTPPGASSGSFAFLDMQTLGSSHSGVAFSATVTGVTGTSALYSEGAGSTLAKVVEFGEVAPGAINTLGNPAEFDRFGVPTLNNTGHLAFRAETNAATGGVAMGDQGVWTTSPSGTLRPVALANQMAPGTSTVFAVLGHLFSPSFSTVPSLNDDGDIAFTATLLQFEGEINAGIWVERDGVLEKVFVETEPAPTTGSNFASVLTDPLLNSAGDVAFMAELEDGRQGVWLDTVGGSLTPVVNDGDPAPGTSASIVNIVKMSLNDTGQIAVLAELDDFTDGIFATDSAGLLQKVVAGGDEIETSLGPMLVDQLDWTGHLAQLEASGASGFNNAGQVAFSAEGELLDLDGSDEAFTQGVFVATLASTPDQQGDFNGDGVVNIADYTVWRDNLGAPDETAINNNGDGGGVTAADYIVWKTHSGQGTAPFAFGSFTVPEPSTAMLLVIAALAFAASCRLDAAARVRRRSDCRT